ncbi:MAG: V-type ATPase 116kDa subunit family protein [Rikenellaceae bacterium]
MIAKMSKYDFVLYSREYEEFMEKVRELGLVDITTTGWESNDEERDIILQIEARVKAQAALRAFAASDKFDAEAAQIPSEQLYELYRAAHAQRQQLQNEIATLTKSGEESQPWGEFSISTIEALEQQGLALHYFIANTSIFEDNQNEWSQKYTVELINSVDSNSYFVVVTRRDEEVMIDAQEIKRPSLTAVQAFGMAKELEIELDALSAPLSSCAKGIEVIQSESDALTAKLKISMVRSTATTAAEGSLLVMSAWAEESESAKVDALLEEYPSVIYIKSNPTPEDDTPVKLTNKWFPRTFELIGNMYALPKYGTLDLTPFFAPFYMLFFAICLCDAGYGAILFAAGLGLYFKGGGNLRQASWLTILCGGAAMVFGFFANSIFGMKIGSAPILNLFDFQTDFFSIALVIGVIQILLGMVVNIVVCTRTFGFKYALGSLGWFLLIFSAATSAALSMAGITAFSFTSIPFYAIVALSAVLMLFFNSPDKNIFANLGAGVWNTYNNVTGLLGDVLSYIRLFAIGLSGSVLAQVFNNLAMGITGLDAGIEGQPIVSVIMQIIGASIILLIGHGINLFMSTISSFVHPMRLTFVEFFKNAGFEMATRKFDPIK